jgi:hypothetical protein
MANANYDALLSTTLANYRDSFTDNIFSAQPFVAWLKRKDKIRLVSGGAKILEQLMYALNSTAGSYAGYDTIATTPQTGLSAAEFAWGQFAVTVAINGLEEAQNNGEAEVIDLLDSKVKQAEMTAAEKMDQMFFLDGTGNTNKDWLGLAAIVGTTNTVGNIDGNAQTWWRSYVESTAGPLSLADLTKAYNSVSKGNDTPDFGLTTQTLFEKYEALLQPQLRFTDSTTADGGFQNLLFKTMPLMFDVYCQSGVVYVLNSKYLKLVGHRDRWFTNTPFVRPNNQDARYSQILSYGQLTVSNRARQGKLTARTA